MRHFDHYIGARVNIDFVHHMIHEGRMFKAPYYVDGTAANILFTTPDADIHMISQVWSNEGGIWRVYEDDATFNVTGGATGVEYNANRNRPTSSGCTIKTAPTVTNVGGTCIELMGSGRDATNNSASAGALEVRSQEWELKKSTDYLFQFTGFDTGEITVLLLYYNPNKEFGG